MKKRSVEISPDEILLDSANLPAFETAQFEGRLERPLGRFPVAVLAFTATLVLLVFLGRLLHIQIVEGARYATRARANTLHTEPLFAERGEISDRQGEPLVWNEPSSTPTDFLTRRYTSRSGSAHLLGFIKYPAKDRAGFYIRTHAEGVAGIEREFNEIVGGENGERTIEFDVTHALVSESMVRAPQRGSDLILSVDARLNETLYGFLMERIQNGGFQGGAAALMDITTGELLALTSAPEYDSQILSDGTPEEKIVAFVADPLQPFLDRAVAGLYAPGSTVKPFLASAALQENIIPPQKKILSTGSLAVPNPFVPGTFSIFRDWKAHGWVDMRQAIAHSSDVYFYEIGGGFENQRGLGIALVEKYLRAWGFGKPLADPLLGGALGVVPSPSWKEKVFGSDPWRIGDTYNTSIGQYGTLATPLQVLRATAAVANGGLLVEPTVLKDDAIAAERVPIDDAYLQVAREGMRQAVTEGTATGLWFPFVSIAAKTGTAEVGVSKKRVHSWVTGFFPYESPRYAFVFLLERGPASNTVGAVYAARQFFSWLAENASEYIEQ